MAKSQPVILMVEDDPNDVFFLKRALEQEQVGLPVRVVSDGEEAIRYLDGAGEFADRDRHPLPCLVILDLKLPKKNGLEVLSWLRRHKEIGDLPVFMLTSSGEPTDRSEAERHGVEVYRVKPVNLKGLLEVAREIHREAEEHCGAPQPCPTPDNPN
jgi:DNA-binding response OmpR family regulator